jgi:hypothetical protein
MPERHTIKQLSGVKVYKVGDEVERDVYIVGNTQALP